MPVFQEPASGGWQNAVSDTAALTDGGGDVAIADDGDTIAADGPSAISVFTKQTNASWQNATPTAELTSTCAPLLGPVGISADGGNIVGTVEIDGPSDGTLPEAGAAYEFQEPTTGWHSETQTTTFNDPEGCATGRYVWGTSSVAVSGGTVVVGGGEDGNGPVAVFPPLPAASAPPTVPESAVQGQHLTETNGTWSNNPSGYDYQWEDCDTSGANCSPITGAQSQAYTPSDGDVGSTLVVQETAVNVSGSGETVTSAPTSAVEALSSTSAPQVSGRAVQGQTLTDTNASWNGPVSGYAYQWQRCHGADNCTDIDGANDKSYTLTNADAGYAIVVEEDAYNDGGYGIPASSNPSGVVIPLIPASTQTPMISGTVIEGNTLTASALNWSNAPSSWLSVEDCNSAGQGCQPIQGATARSYTLAATDVGYRIVLEETASNAGGTSSVATSAASGAVPESGPVGLEIDDGDYATNDPHVTIQPVWPAGTQSILISNDGGFRNSAQTVSPAATINWTLENTGVEPPAQDCLCAFSRRRPGSINFTDEIILDETAPTIESATVISPGAASRSAARAAGLTRYKLRLKAHDKLVGVCAVAANQKSSSHGEDVIPITSCKQRGILTLSRTLVLRLRSRPAYVRVLNSAGEWSRWIAARS